MNKELIWVLEERLTNNSNLKIEYDDLEEETIQKKYDGEYIDETHYHQFYDLGYSHGFHYGQRCIIDLVKEILETTTSKIGNK